MRKRNPASQKRRSASLRPDRCSGNLLGKSDVVLVLPAPLGQQHLPLDQAQVIQEEDSVEVIDLMLNGARFQPSGFLPVWFAFGVEGLDDDALGAGNIAVDL